MANSTLTLLVLIFGLISLVSLALAVIAIRALGSRRRGARGSPLPLDLAGLRGEVEVLRQAAAGAVRHTALLRYDAFGDMGGRLSWSLALLDDQGAGVVVTSIHGRSEARTYAKALADWTSEVQLSPEETEAVAQARAGSSKPADV